MKIKAKTKIQVFNSKKLDKCYLKSKQLLKLFKKAHNNQSKRLKTTVAALNNPNNYISNNKISQGLRIKRLREIEKRTGNIKKEKKKSLKIKLQQKILIVILLKKKS